MWLRVQTHFQGQLAAENLENARDLLDRVLKEKAAMKMNRRRRLRRDRRRLVARVLAAICYLVMTSQLIVMDFGFRSAILIARRTTKTHSANPMWSGSVTT